MTARRFAGFASKAPTVMQLAAFIAFAVGARAALILGSFVGLGFHGVIHLREDALEKPGLLFAGFGCFFSFCFHNKFSGLSPALSLSLGSVAA